MTTHLPQEVLQLIQMTLKYYVTPQYSLFYKSHIISVNFWDSAQPTVTQNSPHANYYLKFAGLQFFFKDIYSHIVWIFIYTLSTVFFRFTCKKYLSPQYKN